jgi:hypothetical protein
MLSIGLIVAAFVFNSCLKDDGYSLDKAWYSIATVNPLQDDNSYAYWLTLNSGTTLWPVASNVPWYRPQVRQRAFVVYTILSDKFSGYDHAVKILDIKSILTKSIAENLGEANDETYGTDPVNISDMWIGDRFLNIVFEFNYGGNAVHFINLLEHDSEDTPYVFEFRHHAYNDSEHSRKKGIVAFDLSTVDTKGEEVELTIRVNTFDGMKEYTVKYNNSVNTAVLHNPDYQMESFVEIK